ncbi:MAG: tRNA (guanosine(37)-N1)-methyltransferase TrmD [Synergistaceae bacterium]|nr:tRNA (guanosine(37)-N1)-methyltransferase TrmD [Synergistaceae bacterium]
MNVTIISAFPGFFSDFLSESMIGRAVRRGLITVDVLDLREYGTGGYRQIDDYSFGGGGMVLMPEVLERALVAAEEKKGPAFVTAPSPQGDLLSQEVVETLASQDHVVIICGHYEGLDERFIQKRVHRELSLGDFVLTGGEIPAMAIVDAMARLVPGVIGKESAVVEDSFYRGMLDHPHYTRPAEWEGEAAPETLLSGHSANIGRWRRDEAAERTLARRPELIGRANIRTYLSGGVYGALVHFPVLDRKGEKTTAALTGLDLSDLGRSCRTYGIDRLLVTTPLASQRELAKTMARHWTEGAGGGVNPDRKEAFAKIKTFASLEGAEKWVAGREKEEPLLIGTTASARDGGVHWLEAKRRVLREKKPVIFVFGTGSGLHEEVLSRCHIVMQPISGGLGDYNHLAVRTAAGIVFDRFFGWR